jgi:molybdate transport system permease protein
MDWQALAVTLRLGVWTSLVLLPFGIWLGRLMAYRAFPGRSFAETLIAVPLVLPPTAIGFYLLVALGAGSPVGRALDAVFGAPLAFSFAGLLVASVFVNIPFAVQPIQRAFEAIPVHVREAAACCGMSPWTRLVRVELPLAWPGIVTAFVLTFAHTLGEFGVVLMVGGNLPGETRTISIAIYDSLQSFNDEGAALMAMVLLAIVLVALSATTALSRRVGRRG